MPMPVLGTTPRAILASPGMLPAALFVCLASLLLVLTLAWHVPMMLWDHLDLVPIYQSWQAGALAESAFLAVHGGHMHTAAYAVLLATTALSHGQPWLDCVASWLLLLVHAGVIALLFRETFPDGTRHAIGFAALLVLLALYPGHLANLQWGWQVAVFLCLAGASTTVYALTRPGLSGWHQSAALAAATIAYFSFATAIALLPTALALIALRRDLPRTRRVVAMLPWLLAAMAVALQYRRFGSDSTRPGFAAIVVYALNFLGAGIARFATDLAPWLALGAVAVAVVALARCRLQRACLPGWAWPCSRHAPACSSRSAVPHRSAASTPSSRATSASHRFSGSVAAASPPARGGSAGRACCASASRSSPCSRLRTHCTW